MSEGREHSKARDEALRWLTRLNSGEAGAADRQAFQAWLALDEGHWRAFSKARRLWAELEVLKNHEFPELAEARRYRPPPNPHAGTHRALAACFAFLSLLLVGWTARWNAADSETYRTAMGEHRTLTLMDGTKVDLNTNSELRVVLMRDLRLLHLRRGEGFFQVVHDETRPFEVHAGGGMARAIGTRFGVRNDSGDIQVVVQEGIVGVTNGAGPAQRVLKEQSITFRGSGPLSEVRKVASDDLLAWRQGKWIFRSQPLSEVLAQMERYHDIRIWLEDSRLGLLKVSGVFAIQEWRALLAGIEATLNLRAESVSPNQYLLRQTPATHP